MGVVLGQSIDDVRHRLQGRRPGLGHGVLSFVRVDEPEVERLVRGKVQLDWDRGFRVFAVPVHEHGLYEATDLFRPQSSGGGNDRLDTGHRHASRPVGTADQRPYRLLVSDGKGQQPSGGHRRGVSIS
jgi:hypothetical protein